MNKNRSAIRIPTVVTIGLLFLAIITVSLRGMGTPVLAQATVEQPAQRYITVVGEGMIKIKPDVAKTTIGVEVVRPTVKEASDENSAILTQVVEALRTAGIDEQDMQTAGFNIYAEQYTTPESGPNGPTQVRYHVMNQVQVSIRDIDNIGAVLDAAIEAGANSTYGVEFRLEEQDAALADARKLAVTNASEKATALAELTSVQLGPVLSVSEVIGSGPSYNAPSAQAWGGAGGGGGTPISAGELQLTMQVQVTYAIGD